VGFKNKEDYNRYMKNYMRNYRKENNAKIKTQTKTRQNARYEKALATYHQRLADKNLRSGPVAGPAPVV
jgi:hypothetical protein